MFKVQHSSKMEISKQILYINGGAIMSKTIAGTYLYSMHGDYEKAIFNFAMGGEVIDKKDPSFEDIVYDVKRRQVSNSLVKILMSDKVVLIIPDKKLPKPFKVNCIKDIRNGSKTEKKIYIDCYDIIEKDKSGKYKCRNIDILISYLVSAMINYIYYIDEKVLLNASRLTIPATTCFTKLLTYVVDYLCKISTIEGARYKCMYMASLYFMANIMGKDPNSESVKGTCCNIAGISRREADMIELQTTEDTFVNIKFFVETLANVLKIDKLTLDLVVEKWMYLYGEGTVFALEHYPSFATMITDAYVGAYINNQKTIEKIIGRDMVVFSKEILEIGSEVV